MALASKTRLGPYEIVSAIGAGGMGEVYRARDMRLARDVALKVLPEAFAADAERMARFEREAKVLASLNHPNIATIHGFEDTAGVHALVMELVEGPTLADRIAKGPVPLDEALPIAKQICEGFEYAHEHGVIHRDLKPANVKITPEGTAKILDFGLAKALQGETAAGDISTSPTISRLATQAGIILGTAAYMSPEQAKGRPVDRRADIWAFGCVLYEMLTGKAAFGGETVSDVLAAVIRAEPDWPLLPATTPRRLRKLLQRCLVKDPRQRLQAIGEARIALEKAAIGPEGLEQVETSVPAPRFRRKIVSWAVGLLLGVFVGGAGVWLWLAVRAPTASAIVTQVAPPSGESFAFRGTEASPPVLSPDGKLLAFAAFGSDRKRLIWVRPLNTGIAQPVSGTDGATYPFWSPDGRYIGFFAGGKLKRIDTSGGPPLAIADAANGRGGAWSRDGSILFTPDIHNPLYRVPASGGTAQPVTKLDASREEYSHRWPQVLPDGKHFLFYAQGRAAIKGGTYVASLDGGKPQLLVQGDANAVYAPPGYALFVRQGTLMAQRLDEEFRAIGDAVPLIEHIAVNSTVQESTFTVSQNGILAFETEKFSDQIGRLLWLDRSGRQIEETVLPNAYGTVKLSPDGRKLAVTVATPGTDALNIWVYDLSRGVPTRLTFSATTDGEPSWSADGKTIVFMSNRSGQPHLYQKAADGTGSTAPLVVDDALEYQPFLSMDGRHLVFQRLAAQSSHTEIWALVLAGDRKPYPAVQNPQFNLFDPALSPDGKWLAYMSPESQRPEVYVVAFGGGKGKWQVSMGGGRFPLWRRDGKELVYLSTDNKIVSAQVSEQGTSLAIGKVTPLFQTNPVSTTGWPYDVSADGKKFLVDTMGLGPAEPLTLVVNWPALLRKQ